MKTLIIALITLVAQAGTTGRANEYIVGPQDVLAIVIHGQADMSVPSVTVDTDGTIEFENLGRVVVAGKSTRQIEDDMKKALLDKQILTKVIMTVTVKEFRSQNIHVMGAVKSTGVFAIKGGTSMLATAIAEAGGFSENAGSYIIVVRNQGDHPETAAKVTDASDDNKIVIKRADLEQAHPDSRITLQNGDTIYVPKADVFYVNGQVKNPGEYTLRPNMTIAMAVTLAGGYTDRAKKSPEIHQVVDGKLEKRNAKESDQVRAGDTVHIPARWW
jgi:polysaccharide export outer membrane protein